MLQDLDLVVNLYNLPDYSDPRPKMEAQGIYIKRAVSPDKTEILEFIRRMRQKKPSSTLPQAAISPFTTTRLWDLPAMIP